MGSLFFCISVNVVFCLSLSIVSGNTVPSSPSKGEASTCPEGGDGEVDQVCPPNEEYVNCTQSICRALHCSQKGKSITCSKVNKSSCKGGCICKVGYLRTKKGNCIPEDQCQGNLVCREDEVVDTCPGKCLDDHCPASQYDKSCPFESSTSNCGKPICKCRFNYKRDNYNGTCIPTRDCPPFKCKGKNEEYNSCPPLCPTDDCSQATPTGRCPLPGRVGTVLECKPTCRCIEGYWRRNGVCVPYNKCPNVCPNNEEYSNCTQAVCRPQNCNQSGRAVTKCAKVNDASCQQGCVCKKDYMRNNNGTCVFKDDCGDDLDCDINEEVNYCPLPCDNEACPVYLGSDDEDDCSDPAICGTPKCSCIDKYKRDKTGTCIPIQDCPDVCSINEEYSNCTQAVCRPQNCNQSGQAPTKCAKVNDASCQQGCVCKKEYMRNKNGTCVLEDDCGDDLDCDINEEVNYCPLPCDNETCPVNLGSDDEDDCSDPAICGTPKCSCIDKYKRDKAGTCIPIQDCPDVCSTNEEYSNCTQAVCRPQNCNQSGRAATKCVKVDDASCQQGCVCKKDYMRNNDGTCVLEDDCGDDLDCDINEEVNYCPLPCDNEACPVNLGSDDEDDCSDPAICGTPKCSCIDKYKRDKTGTCIPIQDCPDVCSINEEYSKCTQSVCRPQNCNQSGRTPTKCTKVNDASCQQGCVCKKDYMRNNNGTCVLKDDCGDDLDCDINEEVNYCPLPCDNEACPVNLGSDDEDDCSDPAICGTPKCSCIDKYKRDETGTCIPIQDCPDVCSTNEEYSNCTQAVCRPQNCNQSGRAANKCAKVDDASCQEGCVCKKDYMRNNDGTCVLEDDCGNDLDCDINEEVNYCPLPCENEACPVNLGSDDEDDCSDPAICGTPKCSCIDKYKRDKTGTCIPIQDCPDVCSINEEYSNCTQAVCRPQNCNQSGRAATKCAKVDDASCQQGCVCKKDYMRNNDGTCVLEDDCGNDLDCDINEEVNYCPLPCDNEACPVNLGSDDEDDCSDPAICGTPKCSCIDKYKRDKTGTCIPIQDCPEVCSSNEVYSNCTQAVCRPQNCNQSGRAATKCAKVDDASCQQGCVCKKDYMRNNDGTCVLEDDCGNDLDCDINEEVNYCPLPCDNEACPVNLGSDDEDDCSDPAICGTPKCSCIDKYKRDETGTCIPIQDCPDVCSTNEEYSNCTQAVCRPQNCNQSGRAANKCAKVDDASCQEGCVCKKDYMRNNDGTCVLEDDCGNDLDCDINEEVNYCPLPCDNEACPVNLGSDDEDDCSDPAICGTPKCSCIDKYKRDKTGTCIPIQDCPDVCSINEEYSNCTQAVCRPQNCNQSGRAATKCAKVNDASCQQGCVCKKDNMRNNNGTCVLKDDCGDDLDCDINEEVNYCPLPCDNEACPVNLGSDDEDDCSDPAICGTPKCSCIDKYKRDKTGTCIPIQDCPDVCSINEEYSNCTQAVCRPQNCNQSGRAANKCAKVDDASCQQGCVCKKDYMRNNDGTCVLEDDCGNDLDCDINEEVNYCPLPCDNEACPVNLGSDDEDDCSDPAICGTPKCSCIDKYKRDKTGTCIPIQDCPDVCSINEEYSNCTQAVCRPQNCNQSGRAATKCAKVNDASCQQGCVCKKDYMRNNNGTCVLKDDCGDDLDCDINEEVNYCPLPCDNEACPVNLGSDDEDDCSDPAICGTPKCSCIDKYKRDKTGTCIPIQDCPDVCSTNEEYSNCTQAVCRPQNCDQSGRAPTKCTKVNDASCQQGCVCKKDYMRNNNGTCVLEDDCGDDLDCDINEEVNYCPLPCDNEACPVNLGSDDEDDCSDPAICGTPKCSCIDKYKRDKTGTCIPIQDCPDVCSINEEYSNCTQSVCRPQNCNQSGRTPTKCTKVNDASCQQGCVCKKDYMRNNNGTCVLKDDCGDDLDCDINEEVNYCPLPCDKEVCPVNLGSDDEDDCSDPAICGTPKCSCIDKYKRDKTGTCIPIQNCPNVCSTNEEYSNCTQAVCRPQNCNQSGRPVTKCVKADNRSCRQGCVCKRGYLRNKNGACVSKHACEQPQQCNSPNEELKCVKNCPPELTCRNRDIKFNCYNDKKPCQQKCVCKKGFYRNAIGECITGKDCDKCQGLNEYFSCGPVCDNECADQTQNKTNCRTVNIVCNPKCYCEDGFARNSSRKCVPIDQCPVEKCNDPNEEYVLCKRNCPTDMCTTLVERISCEDEPFTPGCVCKPGHMRVSANSPCVPICQCPQMINTPGCQKPNRWT